MRLRPLLILCLLCVPLLSCKREKIVTEGRHDVPDAWQKTALARADMFTEIEWTPIYKVPKSYYSRKDVWFDGGTTYKGLPYSSSGIYGGFIGRDVSFYTFLSALHNPLSSIYTVDYRQPPYNQNKASIMYGAVCSSAACFAIGLGATYNTGPIRTGRVPYLEDIGNNPSDVKLCDLLCYYSDEEGEAEGHVVMVYDIVRSSSGAVSKITIAECAGPISRKYVQDELKFSTWMAEKDAHIYRLKKEYRSVLGPSPFMEKNLKSVPAFPENLCLEDGDRRTYPLGTTVRINVLNHSDYTTFMLLKDGENLFGSSLEDTFEFTDLPVGHYEAKLADPEDRYSEPTRFEIADVTFRPRRSGSNVVVDSCPEGLTPVYATFNDAEGGLPKLFIQTAPGEWTTGPVADKATNCRVYFAGTYGISKGNSIVIE